MLQPRQALLKVHLARPRQRTGSEAWLPEGGPGAGSRQRSSWEWRMPMPVATARVRSHLVRVRVGSVPVRKKAGLFFQLI
jgi:hypothetical protein